MKFKVSPPSRGDWYGHTLKAGETVDLSETLAVKAMNLPDMFEAVGEEKRGPGRPRTANANAS